ncbi:MAG: cell division protein ZapE [Alcaligenaceae bacterium]|nr:cell division protein ZapE [Alcaligenaceae bacterium]
MTDVIHYYQKALADKGYQADSAQQHAVERLQQFYDELLSYHQSQKSFLSRWFSKAPAPKGVYLWGGVGRGKSFLMDAFYQCLPLERKTRLHFHEFMRGVHDQLKQLRSQADPLETVAKTIAKRYEVICFDEFHVSDIADAMILYKLLHALFEQGVSFVMTSNYEPSLLYPDGLHRDRILPAIALIQARMDILNVDTGVDYRRRTLEQVRLYLTPITAQTEQELTQIYEGLTGEKPHATQIEIENRQLPVIACQNNVVWFDFETLCVGPRSQNDYLSLVSRFETVLLSDVPKMSARDASAARRFTWLVDVLYDHKVKLIMSAEVEAKDLYTQGPMANEFHRTESRLMEMQSKEYLDAERRQAAVL